VALYLASSLRELSRLKAAVHREMADLAVRPRAAFDILLAVHEAVANAILHGNEEDPAKKVVVEFVVEGGWFEVTVRDEGAGFDHERALQRAQSPPSLDDWAGRGLLLMSRLSDELRFEDGGRTCVIRKHLGSGGADDA